MSEIDGQGSLLEAQRNADEAVARVAAHADPAALAYWEGVVLHTARRLPEFSTNAIAGTRFLGRDEYRLAEPRAMGVVFRRCQKLGIIRPTDRYEPDTTPGAHARPKRIWKSLIWRES